VLVLVLAAVVVAAGVADATGFRSKDDERGNDRTIN
jgi:hypothetical protein